MKKIQVRNWLYEKDIREKLAFMKDTSEKLAFIKG